METYFLMSFFPKPITNKLPDETVSLVQLYNKIRSGCYKTETTMLRSIEDLEKQSRYKRKHLDYVTPSGTFTYHNDKSIIEHSGMLCVDFDDIDNVEDLKEELINDKFTDTLLLFRSPRGHGLKWFIPIDIKQYDHSEWFEGVRNYLLKNYGLTEKQIDASCKNVSKACFLCYDPDAYINSRLMDDADISVPFRMLDLTQWHHIDKVNDHSKTCQAVTGNKADRDLRIKARPSSQGYFDELAKANAVCNALMELNANIAESYHDYIKLGFSLANGLGNDGHDIFHKLCSQSAKYSEQECEEKWQECLATNNGSVTIATFYKMALDAGVDFSALEY